MAAVAHPIRPQIRRNSPISTFGASYGYPADAQRTNVADDSDSDNEPPPPIMFSKVTQALLADASGNSPAVRRDHAVEAPRYNRSASAGKAGLDTPSRVPGLKISRRSSPAAPGSVEPIERGHTPPRIVHLGASGTGSAKRSISIAGPYQQRHGTRREPTPEVNNKIEIVTPAMATRHIRMPRSRAGSNASQDEPAHLVYSISRPGSRNAARAITDTNERKTYATDLNRSISAQHPPETTSRYGTSTVGRSRNASAEAAPPPGSTRIKRAPIGTGSFLKSGPVRRGFRRRDSDENVSPIDDAPAGSSSQPSASSYDHQDRSFSQTDGRRSRSGSVNTRATSVDPVSVHDFAQQDRAAYASRPSSRQANSYFPRAQSGQDPRPPSRPASRQASVERPQVRRQISRAEIQHAAPSEPQHIRPSVESAQAKPTAEPVRPALASRPVYRYAAAKVDTAPAEDQENIPPPTFRRNKDQEFRYLGKPTMSVMSDDEKPKARLVDETPVPTSHKEQRKPLTTMSGNTPHRAAPAPPPKMSILETATSVAGAATTKTRKKRTHMVVNGKIFTAMGKIGKGGSSDVFCVMAENYKTYALKRVKLDDCDDHAVRGYKGEIDLLKQLEKVERVVRLIDWELNDEKQELAVLMEKGDTDLNRILTLRLNCVDARFDSAFTRYHWKEMLECVEAVHEYDIVHSDLKPANFLLVAGRLKLIDFGIANAIDTDNTCNVHRESHVGTPNYMSPESITDTNASQSGKDEAGRPIKKDMRIGKASDVWSLGCILYQMAYGRPPFAHIGNQISRIMAITNPKHIIEFPEKGVGDVTIPSSLIGTLRKCLNRDPEKRATIKQMLSDSDAYLNPEGPGASSILISEDLLGQIINKVLDRCRDPERGVPSPEEAAQYPRSFLSRIKAMHEGK
ncbi:unnamed protein product [Zymoseptoria tritici ST99CH_1A5]|uniref:Protein kinase domain-containing protein n=3 Tax=Zymoseptoria tritici TaxID=1047171 RepID=A0A1X7REY9_ZYMT9|nr:unnamed protein product [Zymoseptoria tritici ST99CH_3D7]SMR42312.1 unnamed protein product [Zymoseptoria tritici ST99CH_1E4]SMR44487.1 unnamed protein product [Zymoseptoria tritici ST99CH_3D1]SMY19642.1 unnamed protein product [Zymoseptoria tritici ST99CH_1A5]